jgi:hypothetical protein
MNAIVWYRIYDHPVFDNDMAYRAIAFTSHSETSWAYLTFISEKGHTVSVQVHRCTALPRTCEWKRIDHSLLHRPLTETELLFPRSGKFTNPDNACDMPFKI